MLTQSAERKRCATCNCWQGQRAPADLPGHVTLESELISGTCLDGGWHASERRARSACGHWRLWSALENSGTG